MSDTLVRASAEVNGSFNNGAGVKRHYVHNLVAVLRPEGDEPPVTATNLAARMIVALETMKTPDKQLIKELNRGRRTELDFDGRWGYEGMSLAANTVLDRQGLDHYIIARIATSELDPEWVVESAHEEIQDHAALIVAARGIAGHFHDLARWVVNSD